MVWLEPRERVESDPVVLLDTLLEDSKLNEFCQITTHTEQDFEETGLKEVSEVIGNFFGDIAQSLTGLSGKISKIKIEKAQT